MRGEAVVKVMIWLGTGMLCAMFAQWAWRLESGDRRGPLTLGSVMGLLAAALIPPASLAAGIIWGLMWAFGGLAGQDTEYRAHHKSARSKALWPKWWWLQRYRIHRITRNVWYLGRPPQESDNSDWMRYGPAKTVAQRLNGGDKVLGNADDERTLTWRRVR